MIAPAPELIDEVPCANMLGESVQWNNQDECFWWTDIPAARLYRYQIRDKKLTWLSLPERLCCFAFAKNDERILAAFASGFAWFDPISADVEWIARPEADIPGNRSNDGRCDRQGRFWMGTAVENENEQENAPPQSAALYCLNRDLAVSRHLSELTISNALCWSPDAAKMYHADSPTHTIHVYDFDTQTGSLSNRRIFARTDPEVSPDGACIDSEGFLWNAQWGGSRVVRYTPEGSEHLVLDLPFSQATCVAFGGSDLNLLAVTSARTGLSDTEMARQPKAGNLLIFRTKFAGLPESTFG